jgi:DNA modification methylase
MSSPHYYKIICPRENVSRRIDEEMHRGYTILEWETWHSKSAAQNFLEVYYETHTKKVLYSSFNCYLQ